MSHLRPVRLAGRAAQASHRTRAWGPETAAGAQAGRWL